MQKDRLINEFTQALTNFQSTQRLEKEKEKTSVVQARSSLGQSSKVAYVQKSILICVDLFL